MSSRGDISSESRGKVRSGKRRSGEMFIGGNVRHSNGTISTCISIKTTDVCDGVFSLMELCNLSFKFDVDVLGWQINIIRKKRITTSLFSETMRFREFRECFH